MGTCKDSMQPTTKQGKSVVEKAKDLIDLRRKNKPKSNRDVDVEEEPLDDDDKGEFDSMADELEASATALKDFASELRRHKSTDDNVNLQNFADYLTASESKLRNLIKIKTEDLRKESGNETKNKRSLANLEAMHFHIEKAIDLAASYGE